MDVIFKLSFPFLNIIQHFWQQPFRHSCVYFWQAEQAKHIVIRYQTTDYEIRQIYDWTFYFVNEQAYCYRIKYSCAVPFTNGFYILQKWVDFVCSQMGFGAGELLATRQLSNSSPTIITQIQHTYRQVNFACHCSPDKRRFVLRVSQVSWGLSEDRFPDIGQTCQPEMGQLSEI